MPEHRVSHQVVRLSAGRHASPDEGACVMELASMLAGERFSDHPRSVDPCLGVFLRTYNDNVPDELRQDLYALAAAVVGTRSRGFARRRRAAMRRELRALSHGRRFAWADQASIQLAKGYLSLGEVGHRRAVRFVRGLCEAPGERVLLQPSASSDPAKTVAPPGPTG